jgi:hypothetical protein
VTDRFRFQHSWCRSPGGPSLKDNRAEAIQKYNQNITGSQFHKQEKKERKAGFLAFRLEGG